MKKLNPIFLTTITLTIVGMFLVGTSVQATDKDPCRWEGKAPACNGKCDAGFTLIKKNKTGDGKKCVTGTKAYCCLTSSIHIVGKAPFCSGKCPVGEETLGYQKEGKNGKKCETGKAAICRLNN